MNDEVYSKGQVLGRGDLGITMLEGPGGNLKDLGAVGYAIYFLDDPRSSGVLMGDPQWTTSPRKGEYYVNMKVPRDAQEGRYRVVWSWKEGDEEEPTPKLVTGFRIEGEAE